MSALTQDLRYGIRSLRKKPGLGAVLVGTLALGIGANTAIFSVINSVLLHPLPYRDADRIVWVSETQPKLDRAPLSAGNYLDYASQNQVFESTAALRGQDFTLTGAGDPERLRGMIVSPGLFSVLAVEPQLGRAFRPEDAAAGAARVAVLGDGFWKRRFGADPSVVGRVLTLNGVPFEVVGVAPPDFRFGRADLYVNPRHVVPEVFSTRTEDDTQNRQMNYLAMVARLKPGVTIEEAQADMAGIIRRDAELYPKEDAGKGVLLVTFKEYVVGDVRPALLVLLAGVGLVLLVTCANVANLLLACAAGRRREIAIRAALGGSRARLFRQLLTESLVVAVAGGALGLGLAWAALRALVAASPPDLPRVSEIGLDATVLAFNYGVSLATGLVFGALPALHASRPDLEAALKEEGRTTAGAGRSRTRRALVAAEVAISIVVVVGAGLLVNSFVRLQQVDPGFDTSDLLTMKLTLPGAKYPEEADQAAFVRRLLERLGALPGVEAAAVSDDLPMAGTDTTNGLNRDGQILESSDRPVVGQHSVSEDFFAALGVPVLRGRGFDTRDTRESLRVAVVNQAFAAEYYPGADPIGRKILFGNPKPDNQWSEIVGVVPDIHHDGLETKPMPAVYQPYAQNPYAYFSILLRTSGAAASLVKPAEAAVREVDPDQPVHSVSTMDEVVAESYASRRFSTALFTLFGALALVLVAVGIYGVVSFAVTQRLHEIGIRVALGARPAHVVRLVVGEGLRLTIAGVAVGVAAALALSRLMAGMLFGVTPTDPLTFGLVSAGLVLVALAAAVVPTWRALRVDPATTLRSE
jgi:putative ABC transport system permease protein